MVASLIQPLTELEKTSCGMLGGSRLTTTLVFDDVFFPLRFLGFFFSFFFLDCSGATTELSSFISAGASDMLEARRSNENARYASPVTMTLSRPTSEFEKASFEMGTLPKSNDAGYTKNQVNIFKYWHRLKKCVICT